MTHRMKERMTHPIKLTCKIRLRYGMCPVLHFHIFLAWATVNLLNAILTQLTKFRYCRLVINYVISNFNTTLCLPQLSLRCVTVSFYFSSSFQSGATHNVSAGTVSILVLYLQ